MTVMPGCSVVISSLAAVISKLQYGRISTLLSSTIADSGDINEALCHLLCFYVCGEKKKSGFNKKVLTDELKPCNIIQVVSEQHNVLQRRQQDIGSQDEKKEQKSS